MKTKKEFICNKNMKDSKYFTVGELTKAKWFPVKSDATIKKLIEFGKLKAVDISANPSYKRYRVDKESVFAFLANRDERYN